MWFGNLISKPPLEVVSKSNSKLLSTMCLQCGRADQIRFERHTHIQATKAVVAGARDCSAVSFRSLLLVPNDPRSYRDYTGNTIAEFYEGHEVVP